MTEQPVAEWFISAMDLAISGQDWQITRRFKRHELEKSLAFHVRAIALLTGLAAAKSS